MPSVLNRPYVISWFSCHHHNNILHLLLLLYLLRTSWSADFSTKRLQVPRRCARPPSDHFSVIAHGYCRSCSPSTVDSERCHLLLTRAVNRGAIPDGRAQKNALVPHTGSTQIDKPTTVTLAAHARRDSQPLPVLYTNHYWRRSLWEGRKVGTLFGFTYSGTKIKFFSVVMCPEKEQVLDNVTNCSTICSTMRFVYLRLCISSSDL